jgi:hypothetical protein
MGPELTSNMCLVELLAVVHDTLADLDNSEHRSHGSEGDAWGVVAARLRMLIACTADVDEDELVTVALSGPELALKAQRFFGFIERSDTTAALTVGATILAALGRVPSVSELALAVADYVAIVAVTNSG